MDWSAFKHSPHLHLVFQKGSCTWANASAERYLNPLGLPVNEVFTSDALVQGVLTREETLVQCHRFKDGLFRGQCSITAGPEDSAVVTIIDVETLATERDLYASRYKTMVVSQPDTMHLFDAEGHFLDSHLGMGHPPFLPITRYIGRKISDIYPKSITTSLMSMITKTIQTGVPQDLEYVLPEYAGTYLEVRMVKAHLVPSGNDEVLAIFRDITDRRIAQDRIKEAAENFRASFETSPAGQFQISSAGTFKRVNKALADQLGYTTSELQSQSFFRHVYTDDLDFLMTMDTQVFQQGDPFQRTLRMVHRTGRILWVDLKISPIFGPNNIILYGTGTALDISERLFHQQNLERVISERTHALVVANETLKQFTYTASHDLKDPLNKIITFGDRVHEKFDLPTGAQEYLGVIRASAVRMRHLIDDLLAYSHTGQEESPPEPCDLNQVITEVILDLEITITEADAQITVGPLPTLVGHPHRLRQMFQNLITNAVKFRNDPCHVKITSESEGQFHLIHVQDNGIGIAPENLERIFTPFVRVHSRAQYPGTGIGLALCRRVAELHDGSISAVSTPGQGTTFTLRIPAPLA